MKRRRKRKSANDITTMDDEPKELLDAQGRVVDRIYSDAGFSYHLTVTRYRLVYSICGLVLGLCCIVGGVVLFLRGVAGETSWTAKILGIGQSQISDAAPGAVLFVVGLFIVLATRFTARSLSSRPTLF
jgi:hypothetical protein